MLFKFKRFANVYRILNVELRVHRCYVVFSVLSCVFINVMLFSNVLVFPSIKMRKANRAFRRYYTGGRARAAARGRLSTGAAGSRARGR